MANNLRIIYQNKADIATITASSTAGVTNTSNLKKDTKSLIWRSQTSSTTSVKANLVVTFPSSNIIGGVVLPFCNLSSTATIRVRGYIGSAPTLGGTVDLPTTSTTGTLVFDTGSILAAPYLTLGTWDWGTLPLGVNTYSYGGGTYARVWFPQISCTSILIEIIDTNTSKYIEVSRLVIGSYWSPKYNTSFGLAISPKDLSTNTRTDSGDLLSNIGIKYSSMTFDLSWLTASDRSELTNILKGNSTTRPLLISIFPNCTEDPGKEQLHQIYGKLTKLSDLSHPMFGIYSSTIEIEET